MKILKNLLLSSITISSLASCSSIYFSALEKIGIEKRDLMVSRVESAKESQTEAKEHFKDALEQYRSIIKFKGGSLEDKYEKMAAILEQSEARADEVKSRIVDVREVATALFNEWKDELADYSNQKLKSDSEAKFYTAKMEYSKMIGTMRLASEKLDPALQPLRDNVLYLKHNLNAKAISSLDVELKSIESKVETLIYELTISIEEAESFISNIKSNS